MSPLFHLEWIGNGGILNLNAKSVKEFESCASESGKSQTFVTDELALLASQTKEVYMGGSKWVALDMFKGRPILARIGPAEACYTDRNF